MSVYGNKKLFGFYFSVLQFPLDKLPTFFIFRKINPTTKQRVNANGWRKNFEIRILDWNHDFLFLHYVQGSNLEMIESGSICHIPCWKIIQVRMILFLVNHINQGRGWCFNISQQQSINSHYSNDNNSTNNPFIYQHKAWNLGVGVSRWCRHQYTACTYFIASEIMKD